MKLPLTMTLTLALLGAATLSARAGEVIERIVAVVGEEVVLLSELENALDSLVSVNRSAFEAQAKAAGLSEDESDAWIRRQLSGQAPRVLDQLIQDKIVQVRARTLGISVTDEQVDVQIEAFLKEKGLTRAELKKQLAGQGFGWDEYRREVRLRILHTQVQQRVARGVQVSEADERALYNQEYAGGGPAEAHLRLIFLRAGDDEERAAAQKKMNGLLEKIRGGADFGEIAKEHTQGPAAGQGGDVGFLKKGQMIPAVEEAAFTLDAGEISEPIVVPQGVFLIQVLERRGGGTVSFEDVRGEIRERIFAQRAQKAFEAWLAEQEEALHIERRL